MIWYAWVSWLAHDVVIEQLLLLALGLCFRLVMVALKRGLNLRCPIVLVAMAFVVISIGKVRVEF